MSGRGRGRGKRGKGRGRGGKGGQGRGASGRGSNPQADGGAPAGPTGLSALPPGLGETARRDSVGSTGSAGGPLCSLCTEPITFFSVGECGHKDVCMLCTIRLRKLYNDKNCPMCKQPQQSILLTNNENVEFSPQGLVGKRLEHSINAYMDSPVVQQEYDNLLLPECPECGFRCKTIPDIKRHVAKQHQKYFCDICLDGSMKFITEQELYSRDELAKHMREGDAKTGLKPHPSCEFCHNKWYDNDTLYRHLKDEHFQCPCCDNSFVFYEDIEGFRKHAGEKHHPCLHPECYEDVFRVFKTAKELKTHEIEEHGSSKMPRFQRDSARPIATTFKVRRQGHDGTGYEDDNDDGRNSYRGRGGGRGNRRDRQGASGASGSGGSNANRLAGQQHGRFGTDDDGAGGSQGKSGDDKGKKGKGKGKKSQRSVAAESAHDSVQSAIAGNAGQSVLSSRGGNTLTETEDSVRDAEMAEAQAKSRALVSMLKEHLPSQQDFNLFKSDSVQYRKGQMPAGQYYACFVRYFGDPAHWKPDGAAAVFTALLDSLPDSKKRSQLEQVHVAESAKSQEFPSLPPSNRRSQRNRYQAFVKNRRTVWQTGNSAPLAGGGGHSRPRAPESPIQYAHTSSSSTAADSSGTGGSKPAIGSLGGAAAYHRNAANVVRPAWMHPNASRPSAPSAQDQMASDEALARKLAAEEGYSMPPPSSTAPSHGSGQRDSTANTASTPPLDTEAFPALESDAGGQGGSFPALGLLADEERPGTHHRYHNSGGGWGSQDYSNNSGSGYGQQQHAPQQRGPQQVRTGKKGKKTKTVLLKIG